MRHGLPLLGLVLVVAVGGLAAWLLADRRSSSRSPVTQAQRAPARTRPQLSRRVRRRLPLKLVDYWRSLQPQQADGQRLFAAQIRTTPWSAHRRGGSGAG